MLHKFAYTAAVALVLLSGALAGFWTNRWGFSVSVEEAAARLESVPLELEGWDSQTQALQEGEVRQGEIAGYLARTYTNRRTQQVVKVLVLCGRPGPISVHTPQVCFAANGWKQLGTRKYALPERPFAFDVLDMRKEGPIMPENLRLYMAMGGAGKWSVPKRPRIAYAGQAALFKIYVTQEAPELGEAIDQGPVVELLQALMPRLQEALFPGK